MKAMLKLVDFEWMWRKGGKVDTKTQVQRPNLGHPPRQFRLWVIRSLLTRATRPPETGAARVLATLLTLLAISK
jgi:hypothetical protein